MRFLIALVFVGASIGCSFSATIPSGVTKTVVFIYNDPSGAPEHADGTGFLVAIPVPSKPQNAWLYLVTAKHVLHTDANKPNSPMYPSLFVRLNKKTGDSTLIKIDLVAAGEQQTVFLHQDASVDVAVIPISHIDPSGYDLQVLPESLLATRTDLDKNHIGVGSDMFFAGMFAPYQGQKRSYPIVRFGKLAMVPEEKIDFGGTLIDAYFVETFSFGGNSGSPVFFYLASDNTPGALAIGPPLLKVAGVMKGFFGDLEPILLAQTASNSQSRPVSKENSGIAVVVPAEHVSEILHSDAMEHQRILHR
jgi:hypothetical protein